MGQLKNFKYEMKLKRGAVGVVHSRRVPVDVEEKVEGRIQRMQKQGVITKVTEPTEWSSYMVAIIEGGKVRICFDQTELNKVMLLDHYTMPVLEDVAQRVLEVKFFLTSDAASGF